MTKMIYCHLQEKEREIKSVLSDLAAQEDCQGEYPDRIRAAVEYIEELENNLKPYEEMERNLCRKIREINDREEKEQEEHQKTVEHCALSKVCKEVKVNCNNNTTCASYITNEGMRAVQKNVKLSGYTEARPLDVDGLDCVRCLGRSFHPDHATMTDQCSFCGQRYRRKKI